VAALPRRPRPAFGIKIAYFKVVRSSIPVS